VSSTSVRLAAALAAATAALAIAPPARARDGEEKVLDAPAPPTLPALAHKDLAYTLELTAASITTKGASPLASNDAYAWFLHNEVEVPLEPRVWYVGLAQDIADAAVPHVGRSYLLGNPEIWGRGVWSSVLGLSSGGAIGVVLPVPRDLDARESEVLKTLRTVRPWDAAYFDDLTLTVRPSFDIRHVVGRTIIQLREGLDWSVALRRTLGNASSACPATDEASCPVQGLTARTTLYVGYRAAETIGLGVELWEVYRLTADVPDDKRAAFAISPSIRFLFPRVQPALSVLLPIATPLRGDVQSYYALRLNVGFSFDLSRGGLSTEAKAR
jgi:hypothetical protein